MFRPSIEARCTTLEPIKRPWLRFGSSMEFRSLSEMIVPPVSQRAHGTIPRARRSR